MIGSLKLAIDLAVSIENGYRHDFAYLGEGSTRLAYLRDNTVYKVETEEMVNLTEADNFAMLHNLDLPPFIGIPKYSLFEIPECSPILACEYISGDLTGECFHKATTKCDPIGCIPKYVAKVFWDLGIEDIGYGNLILSNGIYWLVDCGEVFR